jgi:hypothetical protein
MEDMPFQTKINLSTGERGQSKKAGMKRDGKIQRDNSIVIFETL